MNKRKILIIDDQPINIELIVNHLEETGEPYWMYQATDGRSGYEVARKVKPDLIITDWEMPVMSGIEAIVCLKQDEITKDIPVIVASGVMTSSKNLKTALEAGAVDFIRKPIDRIELIARVRSILLLADSYKEICKQRDELSKKNQELSEALSQIKTLSGLLPICASCKKIRDDDGYWSEVEVYVRDHSHAKFSHGICPDCAKELYPNIEIKSYSKKA
jgi:CheY-like chemotaxis protein